MYRHLPQKLYVKKSKLDKSAQSPDQDKKISDLGGSGSGSAILVIGDYIPDRALDDPDQAQHGVDDLLIQQPAQGI